MVFINYILCSNLIILTLRMLIAVLGTSILLHMPNITYPTTWRRILGDHVENSVTSLHPKAYLFDPRRQVRSMVVKSCLCMQRWRGYADILEIISQFAESLSVIVYVVLCEARTACGN